MPEFPFISVSGSDTFRCRRWVRDKAREKADLGWLVVHADGSIPGSVRRAAASGAFRKGLVLVVVATPQKLTQDFLTSYKSEDVVVLLHHEKGKLDKRTKYCKFIQKLPAGQQVVFNLPDKPWELEGFAVEFVRAEAKRRGKALDERLAKGIVGVVGTDLGHLSFEILKAATLADVHGSSEISRDHIRGTIAGVTEASLMPLSDGLGGRSPLLVARALRRIRTTRKRDPTIAVCRFLWKTSVARWVSVGALLHQGVDAEEVADLLGINPWYCRRKLIPVARLWGWEDLKHLVKILADSERGVLSGHVNPWRAFESRLLRAVVEKRPPGGTVALQ